MKAFIVKYSKGWEALFIDDVNVYKDHFLYFYILLHYSLSGIGDIGGNDTLSSLMYDLPYKYYDN